MMSVRKRQWTHKGRTKSTWVIAFTDVDGKRVLRSFKLKRDAETAAHEIEAELRSGTRIAKSATLTVEAVARMYLDQARERQASGSIGRTRVETLEASLRRHILPHLGDRPIHRLTLLDVERWHRAMRETGAGNATVRTALVILALVERFGRRRGFTAQAIGRDGLREFRGGPSKPIRVPTLEEARRILAAADRTAKCQSRRAAALLSCYVHIAAHCGLRFGEINALTLPNVDFERGMLRVRHNLTRHGELKGPKTQAGVRDVPMSDAVLERLRRWVRTCMLANDADLVFRTRAGTQISGANFHNAYWRPLLRRAGVEMPDETDPFHFHALRHFASSLWCESMGLPTVASLLGHSKFDTTLKTYAHSLVPEATQHAAVEDLTALLSPLSLRQAPILMPKSLKTKGRQTSGEEIYISPEPIKHGQGIELMSQSNPLAICRRPEILVEVQSGPPV